MQVDWQLSQAPDALGALKITVHSMASFAVADGGTTFTVGDHTRTHELFRTPAWTIECVFPQDDHTVLALRPGRTIEVPLLIVFREDDTPNVDIAYEDKSRRSFVGVSYITLGQDRVLSVECDHASQPEPEATTSATSTASGSEGTSEGSTDGGADAVSDAGGSSGTQPPQPTGTTGVAQPSPAVSTPDTSQYEQQIRTLREQLQSESRRSQRLQVLAAQNLDTVIQNLETMCDDLDRDLQSKATAITGARQRVNTLTSQNEKAKGRLETIRQELSRLEGERAQYEQSEEAANLDCEQARREIEELRVHYSLNNQTADLMENDPFLVGNSVRRTLQNVQSELESVDRRIAAIATYRESYASGVQQSILTGDGTLPLDQDLGRSGDGDDPSA